MGEGGFELHAVPGLELVMQARVGLHEAKVLQPREHHPQHVIEGLLPDGEGVLTEVEGGGLGKVGVELVLYMRCIAGVSGTCIERLA